MAASFMQTACPINMKTDTLIIDPKWKDMPLLSYAQSPLAAGEGALFCALSRAGGRR